MKDSKSLAYGVFTALVTPFKADGTLDLEGYKGILKDQVDARVQGVIPCGTTGESPTLSIEEKKQLISLTLQELKGSGVKVFAGTGSNHTADTVALSKWASDQGVDGVLVVTPYYNKPSQTGIIRHFKAVADAVACEVMLYNVPGRTGVGMTAETIVELSAHPRIRSLKEATGNVGFASEIIDQLIQAGRTLALVSGDDATWMPHLAIGGTGVVSVASNLFPRGMVEIYDSIQRSDLAHAMELQKKWYPLFRDLFVESNPVPVKAGMKTLGFCEETVRAPLVSLSPKGREVFARAMARCGLTEGSRA
jgi:4-hydroxy-tetrahydrodipicolinate synthase